MKLTLKNVQLMIEAGASRGDVLHAMAIPLSKLNKLLKDNGYNSFGELQRYYLSVIQAVKTKPIVERIVLLDEQLIREINTRLSFDYHVDAEVIKWHMGTTFVDGKEIYGAYAVLLKSDTDNHSMVYSEICGTGGYTGSTPIQFNAPNCWLPQIYDTAMVPSAVVLRFMELLK